MNYVLESMQMDLNKVLTLADIEEIEKYMFEQNFNHLKKEFSTIINDKQYINLNDLLSVIGYNDIDRFLKVIGYFPKYNKLRLMITSKIVHTFRGMFTKLEDDLIFKTNNFDGIISDLLKLNVPISVINAEASIEGMDKLKTINNPYVDYFLKSIINNPSNARHVHSCLDDMLFDRLNNKYNTILKEVLPKSIMDKNIEDIEFSLPGYGEFNIIKRQVIKEIILTSIDEFNSA